MPQRGSSGGRLLVAAAVIIITVSMAAGDIGTAEHYDPPYLPTACHGYNQEQFPLDGQFAAVSGALWDNGAACGRRYQARCLSGPIDSCIGNGVANVLVVDHYVCEKYPCPTFHMSNKAFQIISRINITINVEYQQV